MVTPETRDKKETNQKSKKAQKQSKKRGGVRQSAHKTARAKIVN